MSDVVGNPEQPEGALTQEEKQGRVELGIDKEGYLCVKVHVSLGKWNLFGVLEDAKNVVLGYFVAMKREQMKKDGLLKPDGVLKGFRRWM